MKGCLAGWLLALVFGLEFFERFLLLLAPLLFF